MRTLTRVGAGAAVLALGGWLLLAGGGRAGEDNKEIRDAVDKIADAFAKGNAEDAAKQAEALSKKIEELHEVMDFLGPRKKGGFGVGEKRGEVVPDGIELKLLDLGRDAPTQAQADKQAAALERMAYRAAAIVSVAIAKSPEIKDKGAATRKLWEESSKGARDAALELAKAARGKSPAALKAAASKANNHCNNCHGEFR